MNVSHLSVHSFVAQIRLQTWRVTCHCSHFSFIVDLFVTVGFCFCVFSFFSYWSACTTYSLPVCEGYSFLIWSLWPQREHGQWVGWLCGHPLPSICPSLSPFGATLQSRYHKAVLVGCLVSVAIHTSHGLANRAMYSTVKIPLRPFWLVDCVVSVAIHPSHGRFRTTLQSRYL